MGQGALMGGSIPASLADDYMPISAALSSLGSQEVKPAKRLEDSLWPLSPLSMPVILCLSKRGHCVEVYYQLQWEVQKLLFGFGRERAEFP